MEWNKTVDVTDFRWRIQRAVAMDLEHRRPEYVTPPPGDQLFGKPTINPLALAAHARLAARLLDGVCKDAIRDARAQGTSWSDIADWFDLDDPFDAWELAGGDEEYAVRWRCSTCDGYVRDRGPTSGPINDEDGHGHGCTRHLAEIDAWREMWRRFDDDRIDAEEVSG